MTRGILPEARLDAMDYVRAARVDVLAIVELVSGYGPALVAAYRSLAAIGELQDAIERSPEARPEESGS